MSAEIKARLSEFYGGFATDTETQEAIAEAYKEHNYLLDTHTAVAYKVYKDYVAETGDKTPTVIASTASAYKFAESVSKAIEDCEDKDAGKKDGFEYVKSLNKKTGVNIPKGLADLEKKQIRHTGVIAVEDMAKAVWEAL